MYQKEALEIIALKVKSPGQYSMGEHGEFLIIH